MRLKRAKNYRKQMAYMYLNFGFREPYQVLVDEEIILEAVATKFDLVAGLERTLQGKVKPLISQCTMEHLYRAKNEEAIDLAKTFERRRCGHIPSQDATLSAFECIASLADINGSNKHRYVVATQKPLLRARFRKIPALPLIYMQRSVMILEPIAKATSAAREAIEAAKLKRGLNDVGTSETPTPRKKKIKEPNPLSVLKRKAPEEGSGGGRTRRKRGKSSKSEASSETNHETPAS